MSSRQLSKTAGSRTDWQTPSRFFEFLNQAVGGFAVDAAANQANHLCEKWYGEGGLAEDALSVERWLSPAFCNPPYLSGERRDRWLQKFIEQAKLGVNTIALLPAAVGSKWWANYVVPNADIMFLIGRLPFMQPGREKPSAPNHDSALAIFGPGVAGRVTWLQWQPKTQEANQADVIEEVTDAKVSL